MDIMKFISENSYIVAGVLWILGEFIKDVPKLPNWIIPFVLMIAGAVFCIGIYDFSTQAVMQGILCAGGAVLADQSIKQLKGR